MTEPQLGGTYEDLLEAARWCERNGLTSFARSDHYYWDDDHPLDATDAFATLAGLARDTESIRVSVLVTPITFRHPAVIAKMAATIDQMSGGRLDLGVGTGWNELEHAVFGLPFPERGERFDRLVEALSYLDAAFGPDRRSFEGRYYRLAARALPTPNDIRLIIGGSGPKRTPTLAGAHADEYNMFIGSAESAAPRIAVMREAAESNDRDPNSILVSMMGQLFVAPDEASYRSAVEKAAAARDVTVADLEARFADRGVPFGTPDRLGETLAALGDVGVGRIYIQHLDVTDREALERTWAAVKIAQ